MGRADADWKNQSDDRRDWLLAGAAASLVVLYAVLWWDGGHSQYLGAVMILVALLAVYFTRHWQPILYLAMAALLVPVAFDLALGEYDRPTGLVTLAVTVAVLVLVVYLYVTEEQIDGNERSERR